VLAAKIVKELGVEVEAVNFKTIFCTCTSKSKSCSASKSAADQIGIPLKVFEISKEYFEIIKHPKHGYGSNMNPCIDCRIFIFKRAAEYMKQTGASFLVTGEVLGQRPMSQRKEAMMLIEKEAGLSGLILRPLSAGLLEPTMPEKQGLIDREKLLSIEGRSRKPQIELAQKLNIKDYPCPAGGCLLTDPGFADRMRDLIKCSPDFTINDALLLKTGRHFRINQKAKLVVGRNETENNKLLALAQEGDLKFTPLEIKGPIAIGKGIFSNEDIFLSASIIARYSDKGTPEEKIQVEYQTLPEETKKLISVVSAQEALLASYRI